MRRPTDPRYAQAPTARTVAQALEETEGAFSSFTRNAERSAKLETAAGHADEAARLARLRYEAGVTDFLAVLDAEREALADRDQLVQANAHLLGAVINNVDLVRAIQSPSRAPQRPSPVTALHRPWPSAWRRLVFSTNATACRAIS
mgnify:CR=1 FL=1